MLAWFVVLTALVASPVRAEPEGQGGFSPANLGKMMTAQGQDSFGKLTKLWSAMPFGPLGPISPKSFREAIYPNKDAQPNMITISAYSPSLSDSDMLELAIAKEKQKWGKRGDIGLYFPSGVPGSEGKLHMVFGKHAEDYIRTGGMLTGITTTGMPVDDYGAATFGKNVAMVNFTHGIIQAKKSRVFQRALARIVREKPELREAARKFDLGNSELSAALQARAAKDPKLAVGMMTLFKTLSSPTVFVVNAGFTTNDDGGIHYGFAKRKANEAKRATRTDKVVSKKVADLLFDWWKVNLKDLKVAAVAKPRIFSANHCAGVADNADWLFMLEARLKKEAPKLVKTVMRSTYTNDFGAGANQPKGVRYRLDLGARDMFGQMNTPNEAMKHATLHQANHMMNKPAGELTPDGMPALPLRPFHAAFGLKMYDNAPATQGRKAISRRRARGLGKLATHFKNMAAKQKSVLADLEAQSPKEDKRWATYKSAVANLQGNRAIFEAKHQRALALAKVVKLRASGASKDEVAAAWKEAKKWRVTQKKAERDMHRAVERQGIYRNIMADAVQYHTYIHAGQGTARENMMKQWPKPRMEAHKAKAELQGKFLQKQAIWTYSRAMGSLQLVRNDFKMPEKPVELVPSAAGAMPRRAAAAPGAGAGARRIPVRVGASPRR
jgi:hypothetical protein